MAAQKCCISKLQLSRSPGFNRWKKVIFIRSQSIRWLVFCRLWNTTPSLTAAIISFLLFVTNFYRWSILRHGDGSCCKTRGKLSMIWSFFQFPVSGSWVGDDLTLQRARIAAWPFPCPVHQRGEVYYGEMSVQLIWKMNSWAVNGLTGRAMEPMERMLMCCHVIGANHLKCASLLVALMRAT